MSVFTAARTAFRSAGIRSAASKISAGAKPHRSFPFSFPKQRPLSHRICRFPHEMSSVCVESMMPYHSVTASTLLNSMLSANRSAYGWNSEGKVDTS